MTTNTDVLTANELPAIRFLLQFGAQFGPAAGPLNSGQWRGYCGGLSSLDAAYAEIENQTFKDFIDDYCNRLVDVPTHAGGGGLSFKHLYIIYAYSVGCKIGANFSNGGGLDQGLWYSGDLDSNFPIHSGTWKDMWDLFANGYENPFALSQGPWARMNSGDYVPWTFQYATDPAGAPITTWKDGYTNDVINGNQWGDGDNDLKRIIADHAKTGLRRPTSPNLKRAMDAVMQSWAANPPPEAIHRASGPVVPYQSPHYPISDLAFTEGNDAVSAAEGVLAQWADFPDVQAATAPSWAKLTTAAKTLLADPSSLSGDQYFFFFHLLIALAAGDAESQALADMIVSTHASSAEYRNDFFHNQLIYLVLMTLADPLGSAETHDQLRQFVSDCASVLPASDAGKQIGAALAQHGKILQADASYPLQDAYSDINAQFPIRKTHAGGALDDARKKIAASLQQHRDATAGRHRTGN